MSTPKTSHKLVALLVWLHQGQDEKLLFIWVIKAQKVCGVLEMNVWLGGGEGFSTRLCDFTPSQTSRFEKSVTTLGEDCTA